jgi:hypothetical protein
MVFRVNSFEGFNYIFQRLSLTLPLSFFVVLCAFSDPAFSQDSELKSKISLKETKKKATVVPKSIVGDGYLFGQIRLESMQYLTEIKEAPRLTQSQLLSARLSGTKTFGENANYAFAGDVTAGTYFSWNQSHYYVNELYVKRDFESKSDATFGRRKFDWSEADTRWGLGLWQPKFNLDALRPEDQGLTGLFYDHREEKSEFLVFGSLFFIPTMAPEIREENGELKSDSRWYRQPSNTWSFNGQPTEIVYSLGPVDTTSLISKPGAAAMYRLGAKRIGPRATVAAAYKPVNELLLKRQNFQVITTTSVVVSPDVTYHNLISADAGYGWDVVNASVSYIEDSPTEKRPDEEWVIQKLEPAKVYSANLDFDLDRLFTRPLLLQTSYMRVVGGGIEDIEFDGAKADLTLYEQRFKFTNAVMMKLQGEIAKPYSKPLISKFSYLYDYDQKGNIWGLEFQLFPATKWAVVVGADLLGVENETDTDKRFINQFRANDRYYGGMSYVF